MKKRKKIIIPNLIICVVAVLIAIGYIPIKHAVYADENIIYLEEIGELRFTKYFGRTSLNWYNNGKSVNCWQLNKSAVI